MDVVSSVAREEVVGRGRPDQLEKMADEMKVVGFERGATIIEQGLSAAKPLSKRIQP